MRTEFKIFIFFLLLLSGCVQKTFFIKQESTFFGIKFFIFIENIKGEKFNGKGEGLLSETYFKFNIYDSFFDNLLIYASFKAQEGLKSYVYSEKMAYFLASEYVGDIFTKYFYSIFKREMKEGVVLEKTFKENGREFTVKLKVLKVFNSIPQRVVFELESLDGEGVIVFDILEIGDIPVKLNENFNFSTYYQIFDIFEFLRSLE